MSCDDTTPSAVEDVTQPDASDAGTSDPEDSSPPDLPEPLEIRNVTVTENPANSLSYFVEWETDLPATTRLDVVCGAEISHTYTADEPRTVHSVFVMGLLDGVGCVLDIESRAGQRHGRAETRIDRAGPIPDFLPELSPSVVDRDRMQTGWTLLTFGSSSISGPVYVIVLDEEARYRWYFAESARRRYPDNELQVIPEGILLGGGTTKIVSWEGTVLWEPPFSSHHDIRISPFHENHLLYLGVSNEGCETTEGTANEFDRTTQRTIWTWRICQHFTPRLQYRNWSHINTIEPFPGERAVLLSPRDQNALIKVNRDTDEIEWILGESGDFEMSESDRFLRQHAPEIQPNGNILLFDNGLTQREASWAGDGLDQAREYSRVIELELTFDEQGEPLRAAVVWDYTDTDVFSESRSEADRLPNDNVLITYSWLEEDLSTLIREVTVDGDVVWELRLPPDRSTYRSERLTEPSFGYVREVP